MRAVASILVLIAACGFAGCKAQKSVTDDLPNLNTTSEQQPMQFEQQPVAVTEGPAPLAHIFDVGGPVHVMDTTSNIRIAAGVVPNRTLVRVDQRLGVIFGKQTITPGPLPAEHRYAIFADPTTDNTYRRTVGPAAQIQNRN